MESKNIADYFVVIGSPFDSLIPLPQHEQIIITNDPLKIAYTPQILDRYPLNDRKEVDLPTGLTLFCLPDGLHITNHVKPPIFFSFVQTSDKGAQLIGCCLTFYEELNESQRNSLNYLLDHSEGSDASSAAMRQIKFFIPRCLCILSHWPFVSSFKKFLCHLYRLSLSPCNIPLERYISNFLNDVPAPPPGKVEVTYLIGPESVIFRRPPANEPNAWSSLPLSLLFECLSLPNILTLLAALLCERQVAFVSSQYSLLTSCAESILSLLYPLTWTHVYIPILPRRLLGVLAAPLPFLVGVHTSFFPEQSHTSTSDKFRRSSFSTATSNISQFEGYAIFSSETVRVYLDENRLELGSLGPPPTFPEGRAKKLMADLVKMAPAFSIRGQNWAQQHLPNYDLAFYMSPRPESTDGRDSNTDKIDEKGVRGSFLKLFVALLKDYRGYLIYPSQSEPFPMHKFRATDYIKDHPADWAPILDVLLRSQAFYQFVDARVNGSQWQESDIQFFDESIEAKINRYTFRLHKRDTPFLLDSSQKHTKTFVAASVDVDNLTNIQYPNDGTEEWINKTQKITQDKSGRNIFHYHNFPKLNPFLFSEKSSNGENLEGLSTNTSTTTARLKRANVLRITSNSQKNINSTISPESSIFSTYLIIFSRVVSSGLRAPTQKRAPPTLTEVINRLNLSHPTSIQPNINNNNNNNNNLLSPVHSYDDNNSENNTNRSYSPNPTKLNDPLNLSSPSLDTISSSPIPPRASFTLLSTPPPQLQPPLINSDLTTLSSSSHGNNTNVRASFYQSTPIISGTSFFNYNEDVREEYLTIARAAIEIAFELFAVMQIRNYEPDEEVYRSLAEACAVCGANKKVIFLLENMAFYGILPDIQIANSIARALSFNSNTSTTDELNSNQSPNLTPIFSITPKEIIEAVSNKDFSRLKRSTSVDVLSLPLPPTNDSKRFHNSQPQNSIESMISSPRLSTQQLMSDRTLDFLFPDLVIDLYNENGTYCPKGTCHRRLNISEIIKQFTTDLNCYTIKCPFCNTEYVPRFTVFSSHPDWYGSEGEHTLLWCELLSPYVLYKEIMNVIVGSGVDVILTPSFRDCKLFPQYSVLFWNLMVYFRLYGLPYAFLITEKISLAFLVPLDEV